MGWVQKKLYCVPQKPEKRAMKLNETVRWGRWCPTLMLLAAFVQLAAGADTSRRAART